MTAPANGSIVWTRTGRVHFHRRGSGPAVVFLHGCGSIAQEIIAPLPNDLRIEIIAPDRPGYGWSDRLPDGEAGMKTQAAWLDAFLDTIGVESCSVVAHSLAAGMALWFAALAPHRVTGLVLVAPFCRPTREKFMPWLRLAAAPIVGTALRATVLPLFADRIGRARMRALLKPHDIPPWLADFPYAHAAKSSAIRASAAELRQFNASMEGFDREVFAPASVIRGSSDETANWAWHGAWLEQVAPKLSVRCLPGAGHAPHQVEPEVLIDAIEAMVAGQSPLGERAVKAMTSRSLRVAPGYASTRSRTA